jgi:hypothetical protein
MRDNFDRLHSYPRLKPLTNRLQDNDSERRREEEGRKERKARKDTPQ